MCLNMLISQSQTGFLVIVSYIHVFWCCSITAAVQYLVDEHNNRIGNFCNFIN